MSTGEARQSFDLSSLVKVREKQGSGLTSSATFFVFFGLIIAAIGAVLLITRFTDSTPLTLVAYGVLAGMGLAVTAATWAMGTQSGALPLCLTVSPEGTVLHFSGQVPDRNLLWTDSKLNFTIYDRRQLPPLIKPGTPRITFDFVPRGWNSTDVCEHFTDGAIRGKLRGNRGVRRFLRAGERCSGDL
jgi:hypothetical protein